MERILSKMGGLLVPLAVLGLASVCTGPARAKTMNVTYVGGTDGQVYVACDILNTSGEYPMIAMKGRAKKDAAHGYAADSACDTLVWGSGQTQTNTNCSGDDAYVQACQGYFNRNLDPTTWTSETCSAWAGWTTGASSGGTNHRSASFYGPCDQTRTFTAQAWGS